MNKTYLVVLGPEYDREKVVEFLDGDDRISNWFHNHPFTVFVNTNLSARELSRVLTGQFGHHKHFVVEVTRNRWGRLPKDHWKLFE